jgi:hypothetical protein
VKGQIIASDSIPRLISTLGGAAVELRFNGTPPEFNLPEGTIPVGTDALRVPAIDTPAETAASVLQSLDGASGQLREIKLIQPSLESAFLAITAAPSTGAENPR